MEKNRFQLEDGLELKVEPGFNFAHIRKPTKDGIRRVIKRKVKGIDVSLYHDGRLCLSPHDYYCLVNQEQYVFRGLPSEKAREILIPIVDSLLGKVSAELKRVYDINCAEIAGIGKEGRECFGFFYSYPNSPQYTHLFVIKDENNPELVRRALQLEYPAGHYADSYLGNIFSLYFINNNHLMTGELERAAAKSFMSDNSALLKISESAIMSLSYGYRLRLLGFLPQDVNVLTL